jgi:uncharacterized Zn-binding protein involved in type VI secretion
MGTPALVQGDSIRGICPNHQLPGPTGPIPAGPLPFDAPITMATVPSVQIGGRPAAVMGSWGANLNAPHIGIIDPPFAAGPAAQMGRILSGSGSVLIGGQPAATAASQATCCAVPGTPAPTVTSVLIG